MMKRLFYLCLIIFSICSCSKNDTQEAEIKREMTLDYQHYDGQNSSSETISLRLTQDLESNLLLTAFDTLYYCNQMPEDTIRLQQTIKFDVISDDTLFKAFFLDFVFFEASDKVVENYSQWQYIDKEDLYNKLEGSSWSNRNSDFHAVFWTCEDQLIVRPRFKEDLSHDWERDNLHSNGFYYEEESLDISSVSYEDGTIVIEGAFNVFLKHLGFPFWITHKIKDCNFVAQF